VKTDTHITSPWLTTRELSHRWKITPKTLRLWRKAGKLEAHHLGRGIRFSLADIERIEAESKA
jgi:excisionase family DNA binding protein